MAWLQKSTIVRIRNGVTRSVFRYGEHVAPGRTGAMAKDLWFTAPPRLGELPVPDGGRPFEVFAQGHVVRGQVWGDFETGAERFPQSTRGTVYLVHGWGGRAGQFGAMIQPLVDEGYRVVTFDAPSHGASDRGPAGRKLTSGMEFAKALDAVAAEFGPAEAVVAHSLGTIATYLTLRFGWLGTRRLVFIAPMTDAISLFDQFQGALGFGPRTRAAFDREVDAFVGLPVKEFDASFQAQYVEPVPTLVFADRDDRQTPYQDAERFAASVGAELVTTAGLGHRRILRDADVIQRVLAFVAGDEALGEKPVEDGSSVA